MNNKITAKSLKVFHEILIQKSNQIFLVIFSIYKKKQMILSKTLKKARERYQNLSEEKKEKRRSEKDIKIFLRSKSRSYFGI